MDMICKSKYIFTLLSLLILQSHSEMIQFANSISTIDSEGRRLINSQLQSAQVHGDLSTLMYYYIDIYVGDKRMKQSLIIDTGSALTAFPCKGNCSNCGTHFNTYYDPNTSKNYFKEKCDNKKCGNCNKDQNTCNFSQGYKEGSRYEGFYASDSIVFGESGNEEDSFHMIFGCVTKETNLFYTQRADGILGLSLHHNEKYFPSISQQYKKQKLVDSSQFMICLGKDAGIMTIGGYKENLLYDNQTVIQWFPSISNSSYSIQLDKLFIGNVHIPHVPRIGFIDSGASFTYTSHEELEHIRQAFDQYCTEDTIRCIGKKVRDLCYEYDITRNTALRTFFESYPTITFTTPGNGILNWYPSEYFYQDNDSPIFCVAIDPINKKNEIVLGAPFMKQNMFIFDPEQLQIGFARANCSDDMVRATTMVVNTSLQFQSVECHQCDIIKEEVNVILFVAVGLLLIMILSIAILTGKPRFNILFLGTYFIKFFKSKKNKIEYAPYTSEDTHDNSGHYSHREDIGFMKKWGEGDDSP